MNDFNDILIKLVAQFEIISQEIVADYKARGMRASGDFEESLEVRGQESATRVSVSLWSNKYAEQLEFGRKPSSRMPPISAIYDWIKTKGIITTASKEYQIRGLAFAIALKIKNEGWYREGYGGVGLISRTVTDDRIKSIIDLVGKDFIGIFETEILTHLNTLAKK